MVDSRHRTICSVMESLYRTMDSRVSIHRPPNQSRPHNARIHAILDVNLDYWLLQTVVRKYSPIIVQNSLEYY